MRAIYTIEIEAEVPDMNADMGALLNDALNRPERNGIAIKDCVITDIKEAK